MSDFGLIATILLIVVGVPIFVEWLCSLSIIVGFLAMIIFFWGAFALIRYCIREIRRG